jgi:hypothetical protein
MEYTNDERINIYKSIYKLFKNNSIIKSENKKHFVDAIQIAREKKLLLIEPNTDNDYLISFWTKHGDDTLFFFPTPPYDKEPIDAKLESFTNDTRKIIDDMMKSKPKKILLDLRCNNGGFIHVFYNSLYPILPKYDGVVLTGVDLDGKEVMSLEEKDESLKLTVNDPNSGKMEIDKKIPEPRKHKLPEIEVLVNSRTASSAEIIMILFAQRGFKITGEPTMGLTSGMLTQSYSNYNVHIPSYWFKDINGKVYNQTTRPKPMPKVSQMARLIESNVIAKVPEKVIKGIDQSTPFATFNHIHCKWLGENAHFGIDYDVKIPEPYAKNMEKCIYIYLPEGNLKSIKDILDEYKDDTFSGKPVIIDIRNSKLKGDDAIQVFSAMFKPYEIPLKQTTNQIDKLGSFYISGSYPYITLFKISSISRYANINAKIWVNKNSISGDCKSTLVLKYLAWSFGIIEGSKLGNYFDYSSHKYVIKPFNVTIYTCKYG